MCSFDTTEDDVDAFVSELGHLTTGARGGATGG